MEPGLTIALEDGQTTRRPKRLPRKKKLTKRAVDAAGYLAPSSHPRGACYLWDTEIAGFGLRVYPSGRKVFLTTYRVRGKQTRARYNGPSIRSSRPPYHRGAGDCERSHINCDYSREACAPQTAKSPRNRARRRTRSIARRLFILHQCDPQKSWLPRGMQGVPLR